jgi:tetratricopeptide (TPR) repeat protein
MFILVGLQSTQAQLHEADSLAAVGNYSAALNKYQELPQTAAILFKQGQVSAITGNLNQALEYYIAGFEQDSTAVRPRFEVGKLFLLSQDPVSAASTFTNLINEFPDNATYRFYHGESLSMLQQLKPALVSYYMALSLDSTYRNARIEVIKSLIKGRQPLNAVQVALKGLEQNENDIKINSLLGQAYMNARLYGKAIDVFEKLLAMGNNTDFNKRSLAVSYFEDAQWATSIEKLLDYVDSYQDEDEEIWFLLGRAYFRTREYNKAVEAMEKSIYFKRPSLDQEYLQLSAIYAQKQQVGKAFEYLQMANQEAPDNLLIAYQLAIGADNYYRDKKTIMGYYERFLDRFGESTKYSEIAAGRLSDLKKQVFMEQKEE